MCECAEGLAHACMCPQVPGPSWCVQQSARRALLMHHWSIYVCRDQNTVANARTAFAQWHQQHLDEGRCIVFRFPNRDRELVLVPVRIKTGGSGQPLDLLVPARVCRPRACSGLG
jgi:hypothetical protein